MQSSASNLVIFEKLFRVAPDAILVTGGKGKITHANPASEKMFGYAPGELVGQSVDILVPERYRQRHSEQHREFVRHPRQRPMGSNLQLVGLRRDGTEFPVDIMLSPVELEEGLSTLVVARDVTLRKQLEEQEKTRRDLQAKETLLKEIHHRVKNNLQVISSLLSLQAAGFTDARSVDMFRDTQERVKAIALIHEKLYGSDDLARIDFGEYLQDLVAQLGRSYGADSRGIAIEIKTDHPRFGLDVAIPCGLLTSELVSNAIKHAYPAQRKGTIQVAFLALEVPGYTLRVADDGVGMPPTVNISQPATLGLQLVEALTKQLHGRVSLEQSRGTTFEVQFPVPSPRA